MTKTLPNVVTHLDIIKTVAVIFMVIDHIGAYFFPDQLWFRVLGRAGAAPLWMFLIGYALSRELPTKLFVGALILIATDMFLVGNPFALTILVLIILARLTLDPVVNFMLRTRYTFIVITLLLALGYIATDMVIEYGTIGYMFAIFGYFTRHQKKLINTTFFTKGDYICFGVFTFLIFVILQNAQFNFSDVQFVVLAVLIALEMVVLATMRPMTFPVIRDPIVKPLLQIGGRKTLEIYVAHLVLFKVAAVAIFVLK